MSSRKSQSSQASNSNSNDSYEGFKVVDVDADGSCFYRSIYGALKHQDLLLTFIKCFFDEGEKDMDKYDDEKAFVKRFRLSLAHRISGDMDDGIITRTYNNLASMNANTAEIVLETLGGKFTEVPESEAIFRKIFAKKTTYMKTWAAETEIEIVKHIFDKCMHGITLEILTESSVKTLQPKPDTIYVVNFDEKHYKYVAIDKNNSNNSYTNNADMMEIDGGANRKMKHHGRSYVVRTGTRGGRFILVKGNKKYV